MMCIYDFARKYGLSVTYHTGLPSLRLPTDNDMEGSRATYIRSVALAYPEVNFIAAHLDDPHFDECVQAMHGVPNMYSDFSGTFEPGASAMENVEETLSAYGPRDPPVSRRLPADSLRDRFSARPSRCLPLVNMTRPSAGSLLQISLRIFTGTIRCGAFPRLAEILREKGTIK